MPKYSRLISPILPLLLIACGGVNKCGSPKPLSETEIKRIYETASPYEAPEALHVFHLGHSLVGRNMPAMLEQLAPAGHQHESQLGWGTTLKAHWEPKEPIKGFETENDHPRFRDGKEALASGDYDALVLTEMVEIKDAIKYFDSSDYLYRWAQAGWDANPNLRVYLYETWHTLDDPEGWLERLDIDIERYWEENILNQALARFDEPRPIYVIPVGQVMARFVREVEKRGGVGPIQSREDMFGDNIHVNDYGAYLVALTHYAVLYQRSPIGLPHNLVRADSTPAASPGPEAARLMQETVWDVVTHYNKTGL